jgi:coproporphyrinogen III oxidase-like Fe-S oxidoreductase
MSGNREPATATGLEPTATEVGSNFVSNYPPYSFWSAASLPEAERALAEPPRPATPAGLYVHVPFCRKRCKFCYFKVYTDKNSAEVRRYVDAVLREAAMHGGRPVWSGRPLKFVYFGGGTPSFLSARYLERLVGGLREAFNWDAVEEVTFECEPGTLTRPKLEVLRDLGVTRLSLGIENFDDEILRENGRAHTTREIRRVEPWLRELEFEQLNIDLIAGMIGETWDTWKQSVRRTIEMGPDSVTIYQLELPYNTVYSQSLLHGSSLPVADWALKREWHEHAIEELGRAGYTSSSAYTMTRRERNVRFVYRDSVWRGCDLLGIGVSSFGHASGVHFQNVSSWGAYLERVEAGALPLDRAYATTAEERLTREAILLLKRGHLEADYFREKHGVELGQVFRAPLERLREAGLLTWDEKGVELTRQGLLRVDQLLPQFYAERYQNARYT